MIIIIVINKNLILVMFVLSYEIKSEGVIVYFFIIKDKSGVIVYLSIIIEGKIVMLFFVIIVEFKLLKVMVIINGSVFYIMYVKG